VVESVVVEGGSRGTRRVLDPLVKVAAGDPVDLRAWAEARKRVYATGLVRGVSLTPESPAEPPSSDASADAAGGALAPLVEPVVARLSYDEWPALRLRYGLQIVTEKPLTSSEDQAVDLGGTVELTRATFLGRALTTGLSAEARADNWSVRGVVSAPRTFRRSLRSSLFVVREQETLEISDPAVGTFPATGDSWQVTLEERYRVTRKVELALAYDIQWLDLSFSGPLGGETLRYRPARLVPTVLMDGRNQILDPTRGFFSSLTYNIGSKKLGSEFDFTRLFTQQFAYVPLPGRIVSASGLRYERSGGDEGQAFLTTERLGFGGATTIRGYDRGELELLDLLSTAGATTKVLLLNQEARFPIFGDLRGVAFFDYGRLQARLDTATGTLVRMGTGLGLRYSTPVGVLRLDVGYPLRGDDKKARFYFGLGQAF
jgi:outer membrane protein assembly factor BamA